MGKPIDYDAPRRPAVEFEDDGLDGLTTRTAASRPPQLDVDDSEVFELPSSDLSGEELTAAVVPIQPSEFRCARCFLIHHRSQLAATQQDGSSICQECA